MKIEKFDLLVSIYIFCITAAELMGAKTFELVTISGFTLNASVSIFLIPLIFTINDVITEVFGAKRARSVIRASLVVVGLIFLFSLLAIWLPPSKKFAATENMYDAIFSTSARISAASLIALAVADFLDVFVFVKIRKSLGDSRLWFRNNVSNFISQFFDTTIFIFLAFYSLNDSISVNLNFLIGLVIPYWLLKCFLSVVETPLVYLGVRWLKKDLS